MSFGYCPECGTKISEKAKTCPYCGFTSENGLSIISCPQPPTISWEISDSPFGAIIPFSPVQIHNLNVLFTKGEYLAKIAPSFYETLKSAMPTTVKIADVDPAIQKLIDEGKYRFLIDKDGQVLPSIFDGKHVRKQVRLKELELTPELGQAIVSLQMQASMNQVLGELRELEQGISDLRQEFQNDRLAQAESAWQQLQQASRMNDARLRDAKLTQISGSATDAKCSLIQAFEDGKRFFDSRKNHNLMQKFWDEKVQKNGAKNSVELLTSLLIIIKSVQVETFSYCLLGQQNAASQCLSQFRQFISNNALDAPNTLLFLNSYSDTDNQGIIDYFSNIRKKISELPEYIENTQPLLDAFSGDTEEKQDE